MRTLLRILIPLALMPFAGCASLERALPFLQPPSRTFNAPISRVKPAFVTTLASMGMGITAIEARGGRDIVKARKAGANVEIELESVGRASTRARISARSGSSSDADLAARVGREAERLLAAG